MSAILFSPQRVKRYSTNYEQHLTFWPGTLDTVESRYYAVHYNTIFHTTLRWLKQNINQIVKSQTTPHISPVRIR